MHGNVAELCANEWSDSYCKLDINEITWSHRIAQVVIRGGSWKDNEVEVRSAERARIAVAKRSRVIGFRVVREC